MDLKEYIESLPYGLRTTITQGEIEVFHQEWDKDYSVLFDVEDSKEYVDKELEFLAYRYIKNYACYNDKYIEILIISPDTYIIDSYDFNDMEKHENKICYTISNISSIFQKCILAYSALDGDFTDYLDDYISLKIFYPDSSSVNATEIDAQVKEILFELSSKYGVCFRLYKLPKEMDEVLDCDPFYDAIEKLKYIKDNYTERRYDSDLINYYYRANIMVGDDVFKYLAYYQVLECIFNEVHLDDTIKDISQIINSSWFSSNETKDLTQIVEIVDQYNKSKNDRDKLKMVLEKYYKVTIHKEAFLLANKEVTKVLLEDLHAIEDERELLDMQKIANIIYDIRCECTHTNRTFLKKSKVQLEDNNIVHYIQLIKKIAERIIVNYR